MESLQQAIADQSFFAGIDPNHLEFIADCASEQRFEPGQYLLQEGEEADRFYLIRRGSVALGSYIPGIGFTTIETVNRGQVVGWSWLIPPHEWRFSGLVVQPTQVIVLDGERLRQKCEADPAFGYDLLKRLASVVGERLKMTRMRLG